MASVRSLHHDQVVAEYNRLFGGVGKPEVYLYGLHYLSGFLNEKPLVKLHDDLAGLGLGLGLGKGEGMSDTEDHVAYVFEVMRFLIAGDDVAVANLTHQMAFFSQHLQPWMPQMCQTLQAHPAAVFFARLAAFTVALMSVETQGFDLVN